MSEIIVPTASEQIAFPDPRVEHPDTAPPSPRMLLHDYIGYCAAAGTDITTAGPAERKDVAYATHAYAFRPETEEFVHDDTARSTLIRRFVTVKLDEYFQDYPLCGQKQESPAHKQHRLQRQKMELPISRKLEPQIQQLHVIGRLRDALDDPVTPVVPQALNDMATVYVGAARALARARVARERGR